MSNRWRPKMLLRRSPALRSAPRGAERLRTLTVDIVTKLVDPLTTAGHYDVVTDIARGYPAPIICALLGAPRQDWHLFSTGLTTSRSSSTGTSPRMPR
jgi:cytochrome P450